MLGGARRYEVVSSVWEKIRWAAVVVAPSGPELNEEVCGLAWCRAGRSGGCAAEDTEGK